MQDCMTVQWEQIDTLDAKANSAQVSASALMGASLVLQAALLGLNSTLFPRLLQVSALFPLLIVYVFVIYYANKGYQVRNYKRVPSPKMLLINWNMPELEMKVAVLEAMGEAFTINELKIKEKVHYVDRANLALIIETGLLIAILLVQTIFPLLIR